MTNNKIGMHQLNTSSHSAKGLPYAHGELPKHFKLERDHLCSSALISRRFLSSTNSKDLLQNDHASLPVPSFYCCVLGGCFARIGTQGHEGVKQKRVLFQDFFCLSLHCLFAFMFWDVLGDCHFFLLNDQAQTNETTPHTTPTTKHSSKRRAVAHPVQRFCVFIVHRFYPQIIVVYTVFTKHTMVE